MGRKKVVDGGVVHARAQELELKPFCYYCDREFNSTKELVQHQRTKHFNCSECGLKFDTVTGLRVHLLNAYKRTMKEVPNAIPGRENPDVVVHGMEGLPKSIIEERTRKAMADRADREKEKAENAAKRAAERAAEQPPPPPSAHVREEAPQPPPLPPGPMSAVPPPTPPPVQAPPPVAPRGGQAAAMPNLSPSVAKLLAGQGKDYHATAVPGRPDVPVPSELTALHPIALQVLAVCGALQPPGGVQHLTGESLLGPAGALLSKAMSASAMEPEEKRPRISLAV